MVKSVASVPLILSSMGEKSKNKNKKKKNWKKRGQDGDVCLRQNRVSSPSPSIHVCLCVVTRRNSCQFGGGEISRLRSSINRRSRVKDSQISPAGKGFRYSVCLPRRVYTIAIGTSRLPLPCVVLCLLSLSSDLWGESHSLQGIGKCPGCILQWLTVALKRRQKHGVKNKFSPV